MTVVDPYQGSHAYFMGEREGHIFGPWIPRGNLISQIKCRLTNRVYSALSIYYNLIHVCMIPVEYNICSSIINIPITSHFGLN